MAQKVQTNNHVNNPTAHEKGSHAPMEGKAPVSSQTNLAGGGLMAPTLPSTASQDTDAMSADYSIGASLPSKTESKPAAGGSKTSRKAVKPSARDKTKRSAQ